MTYIQGPIPPSGPESVVGRLSKTQAAAPPGRAEPRDVVSISEIARLKAKLAQVPEVRQELVDRIRSEIEAGSYDTIDKVQAAAEKLLAELKEEGFL